MASGPRDPSGTLLPGDASPDHAELIADFAAAILRRWLVMLPVTAVPVAGVCSFMQTRPDIRQIDARLLVEVGPGNLELPDGVCWGARKAEPAPAALRPVKPIQRRERNLDVQRAGGSDVIGARIWRRRRRASPRPVRR